MAEPIRIVLADDHTMVREALARILSEASGIEVVAQARDGAEVREAVERGRPDVLVLDYTMPEHDPPQAIRALREQHPELGILVLTVHENVHYARRVLEAGALGYLIKSAAADELVAAIRSVRAGQLYLSSSLSDEVRARLRTPRAEREGIDSLSEREFSLLRLLGSGRTLQQSAREMNVSVSTASTYRARILEKLSLDSTAELIRFSLEQGLD